jgi:hypothetical protein
MGLYLTLLGSVRYGFLKADRFFTREMFKEVTLKVLEEKELKKMKRAYEIKKAEAEEEKKALAKYKYDP